MMTIQERKRALAEDTILKAIAPAMKSRQAARQADEARKRRCNAMLARRGCPLRVV